MALRILCSSARRSGGRLRALCAPVSQTLEWRQPAAMQEEVQKLGGLDPGEGAWWAGRIGSLRGKKTLARKLSESLEAELEHEEQNYQQDEVVRKGPPGGFTIKEEVPEEAKIVLSKTHGTEEITLEVIFTQQPAPEPDNPDDEESSLSHRAIFTAKIAKGEQVLNLELESDGGYLDITHAGLEESGKEPSLSAYTGPEYAELDEKLQDNLEAWLEERGLTAELGDYMIQLVNDRELQCYKKWLKDINAFVLK